MATLSVQREGPQCVHRRRTNPAKVTGRPSADILRSNNASTRVAATSMNSSSSRSTTRAPRWRPGRRPAPWRGRRPWWCRSRRPGGPPRGRERGRTSAPGHRCAGRGAVRPPAGRTPPARGRRGRARSRAGGVQRVDRQLEGDEPRRQPRLRGERGEVGSEAQPSKPVETASSASLRSASTGSWGHWGATVPTGGRALAPAIAAGPVVSVVEQRTSRLPPASSSSRPQVRQVGQQAACPSRRRRAASVEAHPLGEVDRAHRAQRRPPGIPPGAMLPRTQADNGVESAHATHALSLGTGTGPDKDPIVTIPVVRTFVLPSGQCNTPGVSRPGALLSRGSDDPGCGLAVLVGLSLGLLGGGGRS